MRLARIALISVGVLVAIGFIVGLTHRAQPSSTSTTSTTLVASSAGTASAGDTPKCPSGDQCDQDFGASSLQIQGRLGNIGGTIRITNLGSLPMGLTFTVTFFASSNMDSTPIGSANGSALLVSPGQTVTESLLSTDAMLSQSNFYWQFQVSSEIPCSEVSSTC